ncbi:MAG: diaminopimelate epimerase [Candidatus Omnitrophica bacterium]|nr:diaminopimelate epimerase [Candidatus Omnitrophota bacterium]
MRELSFTKMAGAGNDFILLDNRRNRLKGDFSDLARRLCRRKESVGADGLLLLEKSKEADVRMRIWNPDGSEADMCGNGVRCLAKFAVENRLAGPRLSIETPAGIIRARVLDSRVKVKMLNPKDLRLNIDLPAGRKKVRLHFIHTGVPHAVLFYPSLHDCDVAGLGRAIRRHPYFGPRGTNVNFVSLRVGNGIDIRTYERGVEGETLSCGTGSTAGALILAALKGFRPPVSVHTRSGEILKIYFKRKGLAFREVYLEGPVQKTFEGRVGL